METMKRDENGHPIWDRVHLTTAERNIDGKPTGEYKRLIVHQRSLPDAVEHAAKAWKVNKKHVTVTYLCREGQPIEKKNDPF